jgi:hypothetical protein
MMRGVQMDRGGKSAQVDQPSRCVWCTRGMGVKPFHRPREPYRWWIVVRWPKVHREVPKVATKLTSEGRVSIRTDIDPDELMYRQVALGGPLRALHWRYLANLKPYNGSYPRITVYSPLLVGLRQKLNSRGAHRIQSDLADACNRIVAECKVWNDHREPVFMDYDQPSAKKRIHISRNMSWIGSHSLNMQLSGAIHWFWKMAPRSATGASGGRTWRRVIRNVCPRDFRIGTIAVNWKGRSGATPSRRP